MDNVGPKEIAREVLKAINQEYNHNHNNRLVLLEGDPNTTTRSRQSLQSSLTLINDLFKNDEEIGVLSREVK